MTDCNPVAFDKNRIYDRIESYEVDDMKIKINHMNWKKLGKILGVSTALVLSGCGVDPEVVQDVSEIYDHLDVENGTKQVLDVPGEDFKLVVEYSVD